MKPRAGRVTIGAAVLVAGLVGVMVIANWNTVHDHVEAWHFQLTRETETFTPLPEGMPPRGKPYTEEDVLHFAADQLRCPLIVDHREAFFLLGDLSGNGVREVLENNGWRILEQRFPSRANILIRVEAPEQNLMWSELPYPN